MASAVSAANRKHFCLTHADGGANNLFEGSLNAVFAAATIVFAINLNLFKEVKQNQSHRLGGSLRAVEALDVSLQLLVASLDLVATLLSAL